MPSPPRTASAPPPLQMTSAPPRPLIRSAPALPQMMSGPLVPLMTPEPRMVGRKDSTQRPSGTYGGAAAGAALVTIATTAVRTAATPLALRSIGPPRPRSPVRHGTTPPAPVL